MAEAMDAADMLGLHSKLLKLHRNLGDDFIFVKIAWPLLKVFSVSAVMEDVLHSLMKSIRNRLRSVS